MPSEPRGPEQSFFQELRQYLGGGKRWLLMPLLVLAVFVLLVLIFGSLDALPFIYDSF